jgi:hypothetical protein
MHQGGDPRKGSNMSQQPWNFHKALAVAGLSTIVTLQPGAFASATSSPLMRMPAPVANSLGRLPAFMTRAGANATAPVVFVSDANTNAVYLLDANNLKAAPLGKITDGFSTPFTLAVDKSGVLYVASSSGVSAYRPGALHPYRAIQDVSHPGFVAVSKDGTLAIAGSSGNGSPGTLAIYDKGSLKPTRMISVPLNGELLVRFLSLAIDPSDNVFLSVRRYPRGAQLLKFSPGSTQGVDTGLSVNYGEAFDANGNTYASFGSVIQVTAPGARQPFRLIKNGLISTALQISVGPDGRLFAPNAAGFDYGRNRVIPGDFVEYGRGPNPTGMNQSDIDVAPIGSAVRPAFR